MEAWHMTRIKENYTCASTHILQRDCDDIEQNVCESCSPPMIRCTEVGWRARYVNSCAMARRWCVCSHMHTLQRCFSQLFHRVRRAYPCTSVTATMLTSPHAIARAARSTLPAGAPLETATSNSPHAQPAPLLLIVCWLQQTSHEEI